MPSILNIDALKDSGGNRTLASDDGSAWSWGSGVPSGSVLQIQAFTYTGTTSDTFTANSTGGTHAKLDEVVVTLTPTVATSKILLQAQWFGESTASQHQFGFVFYEDDTLLYAPAGESNQGRLVAISTSGYHTTNYDSTPEMGNPVYCYAHGKSAPFSAITYKLGLWTDEGMTIHTNRCVANDNYSYVERGVSTIIATEIMA